MDVCGSISGMGVQSPSDSRFFGAERGTEGENAVSVVPSMVSLPPASAAVPAGAAAGSGRWSASTSLRSPCLNVTSRG
ncbi:hypothetical protein ABIC10_009256 [Bradyrhizobium sp. S3.2.12]